MMLVLQQFQNLLENLVVLLQSNSIMLMDHALIKNKAMFVKIFDEKVRGKIVKILETRSRSENYAMLMKFLL